MYVCIYVERLRANQWPTSFASFSVHRPGPSRSKSRSLRSFSCSLRTSSSSSSPSAGLPDRSWLLYCSCLGARLLFCINCANSTPWSCKMLCVPTSILIFGIRKFELAGGYVRRWRRFLLLLSWDSSCSDDEEEKAWSSEGERRLLVEESSMAGVQKNSEGLANGSKNLAGAGKIVFRIRRMEFIVGMSWELAVPETSDRSVL